ncbi:hypothetical protein LCGC14_2228030 [marine sediment metagenome]|uniref:Uncharacterized protein n=1 Tax=marine sediment metagenome TaxID=412755 RepID=A0A0F9G4C3_9ZZZZ
MSIRLWSDEELEATKNDKWLATLLMNSNTLSERELLFYPYKQRREYECVWLDEPEVTIYATGERMLLRFIDEEYTQRPDFIFQKITQYRPVKV